jgi:enediyne biosynthesis protein E4
MIRVTGRFALTCAHLVACLSIWSCAGDGRDRTAPSEPGADGKWFADVAAQTGLDFVHRNGTTGDFYYPEVIAPGVALFDADNDGDLDVFLVQGAGFTKQADAPAAHLGTGGRLFRNDLRVNADGSRVVVFTDITDASGIITRGYGMGVAAGDYNNDGCIDLYLTGLERSQLLRNTCGGRFDDVTTQSGTGEAGWSVSAAFFDYDRDGWLDLWVGHYLEWDVALNTPCFGLSGRRVYCAPSVYRAQQSQLYHNDHDGTFTNVTAAAGMSAQFGPALGVSTADFNGDGWIDLYVANDGEENQLWINNRNGTFENLGPRSGAALSPSGKPKAGMGVDAGDFDSDGDDDLFVTNLSGEGHDLYVNDGHGTFENRSAASGLSHTSLAYTGFGTAWFDFDGDSWLDLLTVNGSVQTIESLARGNDPFPLRQRKQLFRNLANGRFEDVTRRAGGVFDQLTTSRGAAFGDIDNDGDVDVLVGNNNEPPSLLLNNVGNRRHWLGLRLVGRYGSDAIGARVEITRPGDRVLSRRVRTDGSYASANDPRVIAGLGSSAEPVGIRVRWPDGQVEERSRVETDRYTTISQRGGSQ